jgi:hypothetical protein
MARYYALAVERDLFGGVVLVREWGRLGTRGHRLHDEHPTEGQAYAALAPFWGAPEGPGLGWGADVGRRFKRQMRGAMSRNAASSRTSQQLHVSFHVAKLVQRERPRREAGGALLCAGAPRLRSRVIKPAIAREAGKIMRVDFGGFNRKVNGWLTRLAQFNGSWAAPTRTNAEAVPHVLRLRRPTAAPLIFGSLLRTGRATTPSDINSRAVRPYC